MIATLGILLASVTAAIDETVPEGWFEAGSNPGDYAVGIDSNVAHSGRASASIEAAKNIPTGFGTLMQSIRAGEYRGERVRFSGYLKTEFVQRRAALWIRVDGPENRMLAFDNMSNRPVTGTNDWTRYDLVLEVPDDAEGLAYGVLLQGKGKVWADELIIEEVDDSVPVTDMLEREQDQRPSKPQNLDFEIYTGARGDR